MVLAPRLEIKQSQKLMMNPQMQQAIQLLQLTNVELTAMLKREMEQNPFLAFDENHYRDSQNTDAPERAVTISGTNATGLGQDVTAVRVDFAQADSDAPRAEQAMVEGRTAKLMRQIGEEIKDRELALIAGELVGWLDEDGYLRESDAEICAGLEIAPPVLDAVLTACRRLSPAGIFARHLADCMALQLAAQDKLTPIYAALLDNIALLGQGDIAGLAAAAGLEPDELAPYLQTIRALDPRPGAAMDDAETGVAAPDVIVLEGDAGWQAFLNEATLPHVLVLERDWEDMATRKITDEERSFMKANVQSARWLRKATQQRAATLLRVARAVVAHQQGFFKDGMVALQPLILRDIAEVLELHESTVSRSAAGKLVQTPSGVFNLKDLFSTAPGGAKAGIGHNAPLASAMAIKARLAELIRGEDLPHGVLSDETLVALLAEEGVDLARRTVAKYRKALNIPSSAERRRTAKIAAAAAPRAGADRA